MNIATKTKSEINKSLLAELGNFKKECVSGKLLFTNVQLNQHVTNIIQKYMKAHEPVRSSFEYQLFLSAYRNTKLHTAYIG